jgi:hypothetical protein
VFDISIPLSGNSRDRIRLFWSLTFGPGNFLGYVENPKDCLGDF